MASPFDIDIQAQLAPEIATAYDMEFGDNAQYIHKGTTPFSLIVSASELSQTSTIVLASRGELTERIFYIPKQSGPTGPQGPQGSNYFFPVADTQGPSVWDQIIYEGWTYYVNSWSVDRAKILYQINAKRIMITSPGIF